MCFKLQAFLVLVFCCLSLVIQGLTIREVSAEAVSSDDDVDAFMQTTTSLALESSYRKSLAKIKETNYRVPEHLQFVPKGFVYEDADDVIHVIDPPKQFEELKKIMQHQQQQRPENLRPIALRQQKPKPKITKTHMPAKHKWESIPRKSVAEMDLQTQESQHLPIEILASVRKTENYLRKYKPKLPAVKQRLKTHKIQTVIWEQQQDQQQYQHGQEQRLQGIKEQTALTRRRFIKKRFKRELATAKQNNKILKGEALIKHLNELIQNASLYLKQTENSEDYADNTDLDGTTLKGEIVIQTTKTPLGNSNHNNLNEDMVVKILENSVKATQVIMQQIKAQTNLTNISQKCDYLKITYPNHIKNLQSQIKCMQNVITSMQQQQHSKTPYEKRHYEARKIKEKPFVVAQLAADYIDEATTSPVNSSLIYDDVMTTIRNMLQTQNLQSIEDANGARSTVTSTTWGASLNVPTFTKHDNSAEPVDFDNLQEYLSSLQAIVTNLPKFNYKSLNLQEIEGGSTSKYYFINPQGTIYSLPQPFQKDLITTAPTTIFHQFPDLPIIKEYLKNGTLLPPPTKVLEIL